MPKQQNPIWRFFTSVKLALGLLLTLAATSILGTIIKQGQAPDFYLREYGEANARLFDALQLTQMYSSWWYLLLLGLFALNLLACSVERLPAVWRVMTRDNLQHPPARLEQMKCGFQLTSKLSPEAATAQVAAALKSCGWRNPRQATDGDSSLLFVQKGAWSRLGVYVVHLSILVVLSGAILGGLYGFQAYVYLPEGRTTENIFLRYSKEPYPISFGLRCNQLEKTFYPNGMIKQYYADLSVLDPASDSPYRKTIRVNDPLSYQGLSFYQGDVLPTPEYFVEIINRSNGIRQAFRVQQEQQIDWPQGKLKLKIKQLQLDQDGVAKQGELELSSIADGTSGSLWIPNQTNRQISLSGQQLDIYFRQMQTALLLISKDPGVGIVYAGCILMVSGLFISLFFTHRRIWIRLQPQGKGHSQIICGGNSNKNQLGFEKSVQKLQQQIAAVITP